MLGYSRPASSPGAPLRLRKRKHSFPVGSRNSHGIQALPLASPMHYVTIAGLTLCRLMICATLANPVLASDHIGVIPNSLVSMRHSFSATRVQGLGGRFRALMYDHDARMFRQLELYQRPRVHHFTETSGRRREDAGTQRTTHSVNIRVFRSDCATLACQTCAVIPCRRAQVAPRQKLMKD